MIYTKSRPLRILTPLKLVSTENWPGETPVEILHMDSWGDAGNLMPGVDVLFNQVFTKEMAEDADSLKFIQATGAGIGLVDLDVVPKGCSVALAYEHENGIAEWVIMAMIALNREVLKGHEDMRNGTWEMHPSYGINPRPELRGQTLGIIGLGHIGKKTAEVARFFGMRVVCATRTVPSTQEQRRLGLEYATTMQDIDRVLAESDFVVLSLTLVPETEGLIGAEQLAIMKRESHLINVSRAELVQEKALFDALKDRSIKGAALDVWFQEPLGAEESPKPSDYPFWELDNVLMSPHTSGITQQMVSGRIEFAAQNIDRFARGEPLQNVVHVG